LNDASFLKWIIRLPLCHPFRWYITGICKYKMTQNKIWLSSPHMGGTEQKYIQKAFDAIFF
jgi:hypothetical protein